MLESIKQEEKVEKKIGQPDKADKACEEESVVEKKEQSEEDENEGEETKAVDLEEEKLGSNEEETVLALSHKVTKESQLEEERGTLSATQQHAVEDTKLIIPDRGAEQITAPAEASKDDR